MRVPCKNIPTFDFKKNVWTTTSFHTQGDFGDFLMTECFKEPGEYDFDETTLKWNEHARYYDSNNKHKLYTLTTPGTNDYWDYWDDEENKCRMGVLWKRVDGKVFYTTRDYYFLINYCPIINKENDNQEGFISVRDGQYHMMLYEKIAEIKHLHSVILKKRQFAFSNCHAAKALNFVWFENKKTIRIIASDDTYLNPVKGCWKMVNSYMNHLNTNTGWFKDFNPKTYPEIQQVVSIKNEKGIWITEGNESTLSAQTVKKDVTVVAGGAGYWYWNEEGGIAPKADDLLMYIDPALESGNTKSGSFCIGGSVGDLDDCKPLKSFMYDPVTFQFLAVPNRWYDDTSQVKMTGLFIPTQYAYPQATDEWGNSNIKKALELIAIEEEKWKLLEPRLYILKKSQNPKTMKEAFDHRKVSYFDIQKIERRQEAIKITVDTKTFHGKQGLYEESSKTGVIRFKELSEFIINKPFEMGYPVIKTELNKIGLVNTYEEYNPDFSYYGGVDSVEADNTTTSDSLFSITIYRRAYTEVDVTTGTRKTVRGKIVCDWTGRFNSIDDTNDHGLLILRAWKAKAACERNRPNFINHCKRKNYHHLIARKSELPFDKDVTTAGLKATEEYGVYNDSSGKLRNDLKRTYKDYLNQEVETIHMKTTDGTVGAVVKTIRGYDLMDGYWTLEELKLYNEEDNFDRFYSSALAVAYGTAEELTFEKKVQIQTEQEYKKKETPKPIVKNYLGNSRQSTNKTQKPRNLLNY